MSFNCAHPLRATEVFYKLPDDIKSLPNHPGVYLFYHGQKLNPVYIGKSKHIKQRIQSHYQAAKKNRKAFKITHFACKIGIIRTPGEISALLLEAELVKALYPLYNRRLTKIKKLATIVLPAPSTGYIRPQVQALHASQCTFSTDSYGLFRAAHAAFTQLDKLCDEQGFCRKIMGLEASSSGPCFAYQCGRCLGACVQQQSWQEHNSLLKQTLAHIRVKAWPYTQQLTLKEQDPEGYQSEHHIHQWCYVAAQYTLPGAQYRVEHQPHFDKDIYHILTHCLDA